MRYGGILLFAGDRQRLMLRFFHGRSRGGWGPVSENLGWEPINSVGMQAISEFKSSTANSSANVSTPCRTAVKELPTPGAVCLSWQKFCRIRLLFFSPWFLKKMHQKKWNCGKLERKFWTNELRKSPVHFSEPIQSLSERYPAQNSGVSGVPRVFAHDAWSDENKFEGVPRSKIGPFLDLQLLQIFLAGCG